MLTCLSRDISCYYAYDPINNRLVPQGLTMPTLDPMAPPDLDEPTEFQRLRPTCLLVPHCRVAGLLPFTPFDRPSGATEAYRILWEAATNVK